jgi:hypothetical protein
MRDIRYEQYVKKKIHLTQFYYSNETVEKIFLPNIDKCYSHIINHRKETSDGHKGAYEYWVIHKSIYELLPENEKYEYVTNYLELVDKYPCWALSDNGYMVYIKVVSLNRKNGRYANHIYIPRGIFVRGYLNVNVKIRYIKSYVVAMVNEESLKYVPYSVKRGDWIGKDVRNDIRVKNFIDLFLKTDDHVLSYVIAFLDGTTSFDGQTVTRARQLLERKEVVEYMSSIAKEKFSKALERMGYNDMTIEDYIIEKRLRFIERALEGNDRALAQADRALTGLENISGIANNNIPNNDEFRFSLTPADRTALLGETKPEIIEDADFVSEQ